ncbi:MAG: hypothetical protein E4H09_00010 [Spirochaetales bacterium]|nr:MAG: hypothetical protein E4H09_00010 [Spirochaetales bacterium]
MTINRLVGGLVSETTNPPFPGASWYSCEQIDAGIEYRFPAGTLSSYTYLTADILLDGNSFITFHLNLHEGEDGPVFNLLFALLPQCSARIRMPLAMVDQAKWLFQREGAWLKPMARGERVDLKKVDRMVLEVHRKDESPTRFAVTPIQAVTEEPPLLEELVLPRGTLIDELGQSTIHEWPGKTRSEEELINRLHGQRDAASSQTWPDSFSSWGGWKENRVEGSGFFRTHHDGSRWWLADPDGYLFWSTGLDSVLPMIDAAYEGLESAFDWIPDNATDEATRYRHKLLRPHINFLGTNFYRVFGDSWNDEWRKIVMGEMRRIGFNTLANWSDVTLGQENQFPYVRHLWSRQWDAPMAYRDLPDVYDHRFPTAAVAFAAQLAETRDDPAMIGYFMMNEPTWGFAQECPAEGMLFTYERGPARDRCAEVLLEKYGADAKLADAWGLPVSAARIRSGVFTQPLTEAAIADCQEYSGEMVEIFFATLAKECRKVDPNHLNLGIRYQVVPPQWAVAGMRSFDVFSMNCYAERVPVAVNAEIARLLDMPVMIGEWHFGALDAGLPGSGIGRVANQTDRGRAYRYYVETAAADPNCVGVHYFTIYDQSAIGRFDGEAYQICFIDGCHRPYPEICDAARITHASMYDVAAGNRPAFNDPPEYLPKLFV